MEEKVINFLSGFAILSMAVWLGILVKYPQIHTAQLVPSGEVMSGESVLSMLRDNSTLLAINRQEEELRKHQIRLELPSSVKHKDISMSNNYMTREITISIPGVGDTYFYDYPMVGRTGGISDMRYEVNDHVGVIDIYTNHVYEPVLTHSRGYLYLDFLRPHKVYDYVVAIDAGHGSKDPGAVQGDVYEKDINLGIVRQLKKIFDTDKHNIGVYYTRLDDTNPDFPERVGLPNDIKADVFVSVHINSTDSGRLSGIRGTSVMYMVSDKSGESKELAEKCLDNLLFQLGSTSKGIVPGDELYVLRKTKGPSILCEVGFLTNPQEKALLCTKAYQRKAAKGIYLGILQKLGIKVDKNNNKRTQEGV